MFLILCVFQGEKPSSMRISAHSLVSDPDGKNLILFGGIVSDVKRFVKAVFSHQHHMKCYDFSK